MALGRDSADISSRSGPFADLSAVLEEMSLEYTHGRARYPASKNETTTAQRRPSNRDQDVALATAIRTLAANAQSELR